LANPYETHGWTFDEIGFAADVELIMQRLRSQRRPTRPAPKTDIQFDYDRDRIEQGEGSL
jgi:hypothetical protein